VKCPNCGKEMKYNRNGEYYFCCGWQIVATQPKRVMIFIDKANLDMGAQRFKDEIHREGWLELDKVVQKLVGGRLLASKPLVFQADPEYLGTEAEFEAEKMEKKGFELRWGVLRGSKKKREKMVDTLLALEISKAITKQTCDVIIIVSGDADHVPAVRQAKKAKINVEVASFENCISQDLRLVADKFVPLDGLAQDIFDWIEKYLG